MTISFIKKGYFVINDYLSPAKCEEILSYLDSYRKYHYLPEIYRDCKPLPLRYYVIDGNLIKENFRAIQHLYIQELRERVREISGLPLEPLQNSQVGVNINIMPAFRA